MNDSLKAETEALSEAYAALNRGDIDGFMAVLDPQIERIEFENTPMAGKYSGFEAVKAHVTQGRSTWAEGACEPERFVVVADKIVVLTHVHVRLKDHTDWLEGRTGDVFTFRNGKAIEFRTFGEPEEALGWAGVEEPYKTPEERAAEWSPKWAKDQPRPLNTGLIGAMIAGGILVVIAIVCFASGRESSDQPTTFSGYNGSNLPSNTFEIKRPESQPASITGEMKKAKYLVYDYRLKKDGEKTVAIFLPKFLPRDDKTVIGAIGDVVERSYKDSELKNPRLVPSENGGANLLRMDSRTSAYLTLLVKEDTGEVHSLIITRARL